MVERPGLMASKMLGGGGEEGMAIINQTSIGTVSKVTLEKLVRNGVNGTELN